MIFILTYLKVKVPLANTYEDEQIAIINTQAVLTFRMMGGADEAVAVAPIGIHKKTGKIIAAKLTFPYETDLMEQSIALCANNLVSPRSPKMTLILDGQIVGEMYLYTSENWFLQNYGHQMSACHFNVLKPVLLAVLDRVSAALLKQGIIITKKIDLGSYKDKLLVYHNNEISHIFDPKYDDYDKLQTAPLTSSFDAVVTFPAGSGFINVSKSSKDRYPETIIRESKPEGEKSIDHKLNSGTVWIKFWSFCVSGGKEEKRRPICCYYDTATKTANGHICNAKVINSALIYGNHSLAVAAGTAAPDAFVPHTPVLDSSTGIDTRPTIYIAAACNSSNNYHNTNTFLVQHATTDMVRLKNYYAW